MNAEVTNNASSQCESQAPSKLIALAAKRIFNFLDQPCLEKEKAQQLSTYFPT